MSSTRYSVPPVELLLMRIPGSVHSHLGRTSWSLTCDSPFEHHKVHELVSKCVERAKRTDDDPSSDRDR